MTAAGITSGHLFAADLAFLVAFIACAIAVVAIIAHRAVNDLALVLALALGAVALGLFLL
jgi:hypothetical protein